MSSLNSILSIARSAMQTASLEMNTTAHNIANASVEGYSVQRVEVAANYPEHLTYGNLGTGVVVQSVTQARDKLLDAQFRTANGNAAGQTATQATLGRVEQVFGEPSSSGLANSIDAFWSSWSDLANDPTSVAARGVVRQRGSEVSSMLNSFATQLDGVATDTRASLNTDVGQVNDLARQVAELSPRITATEANGQSANDLRDARNRLLDQMSALVDTQVIEHKDGGVGIYVGGKLMVDGASFHQMQTNGGQPVGITMSGSSDLLQNVGGRIGATMTTLNTTLPGVMGDLDALAGTLVRETNQVHKSGTVFTGTPPAATAAGNFFAQDPVIVGSADKFQTARGISLDASLSNLSNVAASSGGATGAGNNGVAFQLAALRDKSIAITAGNGNTVTGTIGAFYRYTVGNVALASSRASGQATVDGTLATQADTRRQSVSGVATDEELANMIKQQQAYAAAARLISVVSEMSQTLVDLGK